MSSTKRITLPVWKLFWEGYSQLYKIVEYRDGCVFKTQNTGFWVKKTRPKREHEFYASVPTDVLKLEEITIDVLED